MTDVYIGDLPAASSVAATDVLPIEQGIVTRHATVGQIRALPDDSLSGNAVHGGKISDFESTGIDDNASGTTITITAANEVGVNTAQPRAPLDVWGNIATSGPGAALQINKTNGPADTKRWIVAPTDTGLTHYMLNDAATVGANWLTVTRSGMSVTAIRFYTGTGQECMLIDASANMVVGDSGASSHRFRKDRGEGSTIIDFVTPTNQSTAFFEVAGTGVGLSDAAARFQRNSVNGRSINTAGTVNTSGSDYAEYMLKRDDCAPLAKGQIVGIDSDGRLTDRFDLAHSFVVKSTNPSYVGGDVLNEMLIGPQPDAPERADDESDGDFAQHMAVFEGERAAWQAEFERQRQKFDRIAFCGQVPVILAGPCSAGDYVVAERVTGGGNDGAIRAVAIGPDKITDLRYRLAVGKIWSAAEGSHPIMMVKMG